MDAQDRLGFTPLHLAAQQNERAVMVRLLNAGATVDCTNVYGNTPLFVAVFNSHGRGDIVRVLRAAGADPTIANTAGQTPVGLARLIANYDVKRYFEDVPE